jgi:hypothetical protein
LSDDASFASAPGLVLTEADRLAVERLELAIAERSRLRAEPAAVRIDAPRESKRARLERSQKNLVELFDDLVARPAIERVIAQSGFAMIDLRDAGERGTWARDVVPAIKAIRPVIDQDQHRQRAQAVEEASRLILEPFPNRTKAGPETWLETLEGRVYASLGEGNLSKEEAARRLMAWGEEALSAVPESVAAVAHTLLAHHVTGGVLGGEPLFNRVSATDEHESAPARRQVAAFVDNLSVQTDRSERETGLIARMRELFAKKESAEDAASVFRAGDEDSLPEALRRRYAVHVSSDRRTIELFEAGAKSPTITLDARSISTRHNEGVVIADIVALARDRGWQTLKVSGTSEFKDTLWLEASKLGLVAQHDPSSAVKAAFAKWDRERPSNHIQQSADAPGARPEMHTDLAAAFLAKSPEERLADPRLRNAQLELVIGIRTAEKELKRPIAEMPDVARALAATVREQLASGRKFDAPFLSPNSPRPFGRQVNNPAVDAGRIPPLRP